MRKASEEATSLLSEIYKITVPSVPSARERLEALGRSFPKHASDRFHTSSYVALAALDAGELNKAESVAKELLMLAPQFVSSTYHGGALHHANLIVGRRALRRDRNVALAISPLPVNDLQ